MHSLPLLEPIECADWCADGDGHAAAVMRGDQVCWGFESYTSLALEPSDIADGVRFDSRIGVMPRRRYHRQPEAERTAFGSCRARCERGALALPAYRQASMSCCPLPESWQESDMTRRVLQYFCCCDMICAWQQLLTASSSISSRGHRYVAWSSRGGEQGCPGRQLPTKFGT